MKKNFHCDFSLDGSQEYQRTYLFNSTKQINSRKTNQDQKPGRAFSEKYRRSSKILTETTFKALFTNQKPRIYVPHWEPTKKILSKYLFPSCKLTNPKDEVFFYTPFMLIQVQLTWIHLVSGFYPRSSIRGIVRCLWKSWRIIVDSL